MPSRPPIVSRRQVLLGAASLAVLGAATTAGCSRPAPPPPELDDLTTALDRARADSKLATEAAATARGTTAATLSTVAAERSAHADALSKEIVRLTGSNAPTTSVTVTTSPSGAAAPAPGTDDVIGALRASADSASHAAAALSGYRAGLLASIAAACAAAYTVALAPTGGSR
ncbi:hypothetical protein Mycch_2044 [Mycolicibacterium chubuense NBB4]|uniref:Tat pathway signal sequence domain protein n=1 Tax=Mycolicibacterium chubuense (strain NBB4) TaxID=710421 RepID=I4BHS0_MYCCN|nr:hypothetical protein Mycch_2044 [Mycolicibacterium chubuense NBB4]